MEYISKTIYEENRLQSNSCATAVPADRLQIRRFKRSGEAIDSVNTSQKFWTTLCKLCLDSSDSNPRQVARGRSLPLIINLPRNCICHAASIHQQTCELLAKIPIYLRTQHRYLIVDGTCTRVRSTDFKNYSGYKHHKNSKVQVVDDDGRRVLSVSKGYSARVHDKTIWNKEFKSLEGILSRPVLGDKAYAGGKGEDEILFRPVKRNEIPYKNNKNDCKAFNQELSRWRVTVEHVFAQLKAFKILRNLFPLQSLRYATCFKAIALVYNLNLDAKNAGIAKF